MRDSFPALHLPDVPGLTFNDGILNPMLEYDFGPEFHGNDLSGVITLQPPRITRIIPTYVPSVNADGNETSGVASVLHQAPLGTYLGWNITASGFHKGQVCNYQGGWIPFAKTKAERLANHDPRRSLEERYVSHQGYVDAVKAAAANAVSQGFLLQADADTLITAAQASNVLNP